MGSAGMPPLRDHRFEDYASSVEAFSNLSQSLWGQPSNKKQNLGTIAAYQATQFGNANGAVIGGIAIVDDEHNEAGRIGLCVSWIKCERNPCVPPSMN